MSIIQKIKSLGAELNLIILNITVVRCVVWDFDGTLFRNEKIALAYEKAYLDYARNHSNDKKISMKKFQEVTKNLGSWKKAAAYLTKTDELSIQNFVDKKVPKVKFARRDMKTVGMCQSYSKFRQIILTNAARADVHKTLIKMGFKKDRNGKLSPFEIIFSREDGINKPDRKSFIKVLNYTKMPAFRHLLIGDSYNDDIYPAKKIGFITRHISQIL